MRAALASFLAVASAACGGSSPVPHRAGGEDPADERLRRSRLSQTVEGRKPVLIACYERALALEPPDSDLGGKLVVNFSVDADGAVTDIAIDPSASSIAHTSFEACVVRELAGIRFPGSGRAQLVRYPFLFNNLPGSPPRDRTLR